jgi:hypothetical protein
MSLFTKTIRTGVPLFVVLSLFLGCKKNLDVESGTRTPSILRPDSATPSITVPNVATFYSNSSSLEIRGICLANATVVLSGDDEQTVSCDDFEYSFTVNKAVDGSYNFSISQVLGSGQSSAESLLWIRKTSVSQPALTNPTTNPYFSGETILTVTGGCETGSEIILAQGGVGQTTCINSQFSLDVTQFTDGTYPIEILQRDQAGNENSSSFDWIKQGLEASPDNPQVIVTRSQVFSVSGGTNSFTVTFTENNSGGTFDEPTLTYTAGTVAGVVDKIRIEDGQGFSSDIDIQVIPDAPDHFEFPTPNGDNQTQIIGQNLVEPIVAKVVDQYGNAVPFYPVIFEQTSGDVTLIDSMRQVTDVDGLATMNIIQGFTEVRSYVDVKPQGVLLPDVNSTGRTRLTYQILSDNNNSNRFDLIFSTGSNPEDVYVGDVNGDSTPDMLILNKGENSVSVLSGLGNGLMTTLPKVLNVCISPSAMAVADFNGDSFVDLLLTCTSNNEYAFLSGNGNTAVRTALTLDESLPIALAVADFDGDSDLDFVLSSAGNSRLAVRLGNGDGTFNSPNLPLLVTGSSPSQLAIGDFDNLNGSDIAVVNAGEDTFSTFLNDGSAGFASQVKYNTGVAPADILSIDLNSDTYNDLVVANNIDNTVTTYLNNQDGTFDTFGINTSVGAGPIALYGGNIDGDGFSDLIVANIGDNTVSILIGANNGTFGVQPALSTSTSPINVTSADLNNDTFNDLVIVANGESNVQIVPGQVSGQLGFLTSVGNNPTVSLSGDLEGDSVPDKVVLNRNDNTISLFKGVGNGLFTTLGSLSGTGDTRDILLKDLNEDGLLDLAIVFGASGLRVYLSQGSGTFQSPASYATSSQPENLTSGDFNNDGFIDLAVSCSGLGRISFFPGLGDGTFGSRQDSNTGAQPLGISAADLNQDGVVDLAVAQASELGGSLGVLISNGDGSFQTPVNYVAESGTVKVETGYFNSDAFVDIVVLNDITASVSVFTNKGDGTFNDASNFFSGFTPTSLTKGDFNGDNRVDLIVGNGINQTATILLGSLSGSFALNTTLNTFINTADVEVNDLNQDGALDITALDGSFNFMKVFLGH